MRLVVYTQVLERRGERLAAKGGDEYVIARPTIAAVCALGHTGLKAIVDRFEVSVPENADYVEYVVDWALLADGEPTNSERDQLEYEGKIIYPPKEVPCDLVR